MSDSRLKAFPSSRPILEDTPSTCSTPAINFSIKSSPAATNSHRKSSLLVSPLVANLQRATTVAGPPELIFPRATLPGNIVLPPSPLEPTLRKLISSRANRPRAEPSEIDVPESSQRPMTTHPTPHLHSSHPGELHSIFLRAFHSPWSGIGRRLALAIRGFISLYMTVTFIMVVAWQARTDATVSTVLFKFETISFFWQVAYAWITFVSFSGTFGCSVRSSGVVWSCEP